MHYIPRSPSGLDPKVDEELDRQADARPTREVLGPQVAAETAEEAEIRRVSDLLYDAAAKGDQAEFLRLWQQYVIPLERQKEAEAKRQPQ
jgi:hypothetical protein